MSETQQRDAIVAVARSLFERGYGCGSSGNISLHLDDGLLITPTNSSLGSLDPARLSRLDATGRHLAGDPPSKEAFLHLAMYRQRPAERAVVHLHATHSVAVACLEEVDPANVLPPLTPYYVARIGSLPLVPYFRPGDPSLAAAITAYAARHHALLLANHGPVVAGPSLEAASYMAEELEETAKLYLLLRNERFRCLTPAQVAELKQAFPS